MNPRIRARLEQIRERHREIAGLLADPETQHDPRRFQELSRELSRLEAVAERYAQWEQAAAEREEARALLQDPEMAELARDALAEAEQRLAELEPQLLELLLPRDPDDERNVYLEIRAGTGGAEAALFAGDLLRAYLRLAERRGWQVETLDQRPGEHGGYKEVVVRISGREVYLNLKFESGVHRVQRVPETESQGRIHTSAVTVAILPEAEAIDSIELDPGDLRIDTFRASGAGGQHVNKTDSAVRITHRPSGIVVECQDQRSQHKNKARALALLQARLLDRARGRQQAERAADRKLQVGSGDRSERIRTYNFPQNRVTDHRIQLTLYKLDEILDGHLELIIEPLLREYRAAQLAELEAD